MRSGKTKTARKLAKKLGINWIQTDLLRTAIRESFPRKLMLEKFPLKKMELVDKDHLLLFEKYSSKQLLKNELTEAGSLWPGIKAFINHLYEEKEDCIIEGVHLLPSFINEFKGKKIAKQLRIAYLVKKDPESIKKGIRSNDDEVDWLPAYIKTEKCLDGAIKAIQEEGLYFERKAKKYGFKVFVTDKDFKDKIEQVIRHLS